MLAHSVSNSHGALPMTWYLVRERREPVALVGSITLARQIVLSQPPGCYVVDEIQVTIDRETTNGVPQFQEEVRSTAVTVRHDGSSCRVDNLRDNPGFRWNRPAP